MKNTETSIELRASARPARDITNGSRDGSSCAGPGQLDLGLVGTPAPRCEPRRRRVTFARAKWWLDQARRIVDNAVEWKPVPPARPEQTTLELRRPTEVTLAK